MGPDLGVFLPSLAAVVGGPGANITMDVFKLSPRWAAHSCFTGSPEPRLRLEPIDLAILVRVAGAISDWMPPVAAEAGAFEERLRLCRDAADPAYPILDCYVRMSDIGMRDPAKWLRAIERLRHVRNRDLPCFTSVTLLPDGKTARFDIAPGHAMITAHRAFGHRMRPETVRKAARWLPFSDRPFVDVDPVSFTRFASVSSVPVALRIAAWLKARSTDGLPPPSRFEIDDLGRWLIRADQDTVGRYLGITTTRSTLRYYADLFDRVRLDLAGVGVDFRAVSESVGRSMTNWRVRFHLVERHVQEWADRDDTPDDDMVDRNEASATLSHIVRASPPAAPVEITRSEVFTR